MNKKLFALLLFTLVNSVPLMAMEKNTDTTSTPTTSEPASSEPAATPEPAAAEPATPEQPSAPEKDTSSFDSIVDVINSTGGGEVNCIIS